METDGELYDRMSKIYFNQDEQTRERIFAAYERIYRGRPKNKGTCLRDAILSCGLINHDPLAGTTEAAAEYDEIFGAQALMEP